MPSRYLLELLLDTGLPGTGRDKTSSLSDDVLTSLTQRSLLSCFGDALDADGIASLGAALDGLDDPRGWRAAMGKAPVYRAIYEAFVSLSPRHRLPYAEFGQRFGRFIDVLDAALEQAREPRLMELPCREFGGLSLDELARMRAPGALSDYIVWLAEQLRRQGALAANDSDHLIELVEKMAGAPGYLRFLSGDRKRQEAVRLSHMLMTLRSSGAPADPVLGDAMVSLGLLLFNISPSEKIAAFLASARPSDASNALLYHYYAIMALNHMLAGRLDLAARAAERAMSCTADADMVAYMGVLQGCIAVRQWNYNLAIHRLKNANATAHAGRMKALASFYLGIVLFEKKEYANALECFEAAGARVADPLDLATVQNNIGTCAMLIGDVQRAERAFAAMEQLSDRLSGDYYRRCRLVASSYGGAICRARGEHTKAVERYRQALNLAFGTHDSRSIANQLGNLGSAYGQVGDRTKAMQFLDACMTCSERAGYWDGIRYAYWHIYRLLSQSGHLSEAHKFIETYTSRYPELRSLR